MAVANGRIATSNLSSLPLAFSNKREQEHLTKAAYASLVRMMLRATADTGSYFSVWDAYRSFDEQVAMLKLNYYPSPNGTRTYAGQKWAQRAGRPKTASPGYSNHGTGVSVDIHPGAIQSWLKGNAARFGWVNDVPSESWHWSYLNPGSDQYRAEGTPDVKAIQKALGVEADGKPGPGTAKAVKAFQAKQKLTADGIPGQKTVSVLLGKDSAPVVSAPAAKPSTAIGTYKLDRSPSPNCYGDRKGHSIKHVTIHHWGAPTGQKRDGIISWLVNPKANVSAHYVVTKGHVTQLVEESCGSWANGNKTANLESITIECDPNDVDGTIPTLAALIRDIRGRHGNLPIYPHSHWTATECPGAYRDRLTEIDALARGGFITPDTPAVKPVTPSAKPSPAPKPAPRVDGRFGTATVKAAQRFLNARGAKLKVDGKAGHNFWSALQRYLGTPVDGKVDNQSHKADSLGNGITQGWGYTGPGSKGSTMVKALQRWCGVKADGVWGEKTTAAFQRKLIAHGYVP